MKVMCLDNVPLVSCVVLCASALYLAIPPAKMPIDLGVSPRRIDLGEVVAGQRGYGAIRLSNPLATAITDISVDASCGCIAHEIECDSLEPGESSSLRVQIATNERSGPTENYVVVQYSVAGDRRSQTVPIRAVVVPAD